MVSILEYTLIHLLCTLLFTLQHVIRRLHRFTTSSALDTIPSKAFIHTLAVAF